MQPAMPADRTTSRQSWSRLDSPFRPVLAVLLIGAVPAACTPPGILRLQVVDGEGQVRIAGARTARVLTVQVTDETGKPVPGTTVHFRLPEDGPGGATTAGMKWDIQTTGADGRASLDHIHWNRAPGQFNIRITASKDQVRAGIVSAQYLADAAGAKGAGATGRGRWMTLGLVVAGAAAGGLAAGWLRSQSSGAPGAVAPPAASTAPAIQIGAPAITVGKP